MRVHLGGCSARGANGSNKGAGPGEVASPGPTGEAWTSFRVYRAKLVPPLVRPGGLSSFVRPSAQSATNPRRRPAWGGLSAAPQPAEPPFIAAVGPARA